MFAGAWRPASESRSPGHRGTASSAAASHVRRAGSPCLRLEGRARELRLRRPREGPVRGRRPVRLLHADGLRSVHPVARRAHRGRAFAWLAWSERLLSRILGTFSALYVLLVVAGYVSWTYPGSPARPAACGSRSLHLARRRAQPVTRVSRMSAPAAPACDRDAPARARRVLARVHRRAGRRSSPLPGPPPPPDPAVAPECTTAYPDATRRPTSRRRAPSSPLAGGARRIDAVRGEPDERNDRGRAVTSLPPRPTSCSPPASRSWRATRSCAATASAATRSSTRPLPSSSSRSRRMPRRERTSSRAGPLLTRPPGLHGRGAAVGSLPPLAHDHHLARTALAVPDRKDPRDHHNRNLSVHDPDGQRATRYAVRTGGVPGHVLRRRRLGSCSRTVQADLGAVAPHSSGVVERSSGIGKNVGVQPDPTRLVASQGAVPAVGSSQSSAAARSQVDPRRPADGSAPAAAGCMHAPAGSAGHTHRSPARRRVPPARPRARPTPQGSSHPDRRLNRS